MWLPIRLFLSLCLLAHEELFEVGKAAGHGDALLGAFHEGLQAGGDGHVDAQDGVDLLLELGGVGGLAEDAGLAGLQLLFQGAIAAGTVGIENVARLGIAAAHGLDDLLVAIGGSADETGDALVGLGGGDTAVLAVEINDAGKVGWIAHVHGVGQRLLGGLGGVVAGLQVVVEDVVGIVGCDEALHGQSHGVAEEGGADIAEVA